MGTKDQKMNIYSVTDERFLPYGRVITDYQLDDLLKAMEETPQPEDVVYVPSVPALEALEVKEAFQERFFGGLPIQIGYCNGHNHLLNAVEYHRSSELNVAVTDMILIVGQQQDITPDYSYDTARMEAFFVPAGTCVELYATTLHYAPCRQDGEGFYCVVVLPKDTNTELSGAAGSVGEDRLLFARNKWLIGHPESGLQQDGAFIGLKGENLSV